MILGVLWKYHNLDKFISRKNCLQLFLFFLCYNILNFEEFGFKVCYFYLNTYKCGQKHQRKFVPMIGNRLFFYFPVSAKNGFHDFSKLLSKLYFSISFVYQDDCKTIFLHLLIFYITFFSLSCFHRLFQFNLGTFLDDFSKQVDLLFHMIFFKKVNETSHRKLFCF